MQPLPLKAEGRQCPRLFQREGSWRPRTATSSSSISLRARDFYACRYSRLCYERLILQVFPNEEIRVLLYLLHPSAEGFSTHLRRYFQIARHNVLCGTGISFCHFRKVNGQPPFPPLTMFPNLPQESKCEWHFEVPHVGIGVGNFHRFWSQRVLNDLPLTVKKVVNHLEEIHIVHPKNVSQLQPTLLFSYRKTNPTPFFLEMLTK